MKKEERKNKIYIVEVWFSNSTKVSGTLSVVVYLDSKMLFVYRLFALLFAHLDMYHAYIVVTVYRDYW